MRGQASRIIVTSLVVAVLLGCKNSSGTEARDQQRPQPAEAPASEASDRDANAAGPAAEPSAEPEPGQALGQVPPPPIGVPLPPYAVGRLGTPATTGADAALAKPEPTTEGRGGAVTDLDWSGDGSVIATASSDGKVRLWDATTYTLERTINGAPGEHRRVALSHDAATVAINADTQAYVFDGRTGDRRNALLHEDRVLAVAITRDGTIVASGGLDGVRIWSTEDSWHLHHLEQRGKQALSLEISPDGARLASGWSDARVRIFELRTGKLEKTIRVGRAPEALVYDEQWLAARSGEHQLGIFELERGKAVRKIDLPRPLAFGLGGKLLIATGVAGEEARTVMLVDAANGHMLLPFVGHGGAITAGAFSPDGIRFASASEDATVLIWATP